MPEDPAVAIGRLRWPVILATREQLAQATGTGIDETLTDLQRVHADVQPVGALTFWGQEQVDGPITHRIFVRWLDSVPNTAAVQRTTTLRSGIVRLELFRVRRIREIAGRKRFAILECELEKIVE